MTLAALLCLLAPFSAIASPASAAESWKARSLVRKIEWNGHLWLPMAYSEDELREALSANDDPRAGIYVPGEAGAFALGSYEIDGDLACMLVRYGLDSGGLGGIWLFVLDVNGVVSSRLELASWAMGESGGEYREAWLREPSDGTGRLEIVVRRRYFDSRALLEGGDADTSTGDSLEFYSWRSPEFRLERSVDLLAAGSGGDGTRALLETFEWGFRPPF